MKVIAQLKDQIKDLEEQIRQRKAAKRILCGCGKRHAIRDLDLIVTHHIDYDGDWHSGEWNFVGPCCTRNRMLFRDSYEDRREGKDAEGAFQKLFGYSVWKSVTNEYHSMWGGIRPTNNYDVDDNRKRFGLPEKKAE